MPSKTLTYHQARARLKKLSNAHAYLVQQSHLYYSTGNVSKECYLMIITPVKAISGRGPTWEEAFTDLEKQIKNHPKPFTMCQK